MFVNFSKRLVAWHRHKWERLVAAKDVISTAQEEIKLFLGRSESSADYFSGSLASLVTFSGGSASRLLGAFHFDNSG